MKLAQCRRKVGLIAEMLQDVVVKNMSPADAAKAAQTKMEQAFAEIKR